jgi:nucleoside-diphosphate-sugar epimerase
MKTATPNTDERLDMPGKVLVTGATGFIGTRLCERLALIHRIPYRALVRSFSHANRIARLGAEMVSGDLCNQESLARALEGCDTVFHLAHGEDRDGPRQMKSVIAAVRRAKIRRVVYTSSMSVHGPDPGPECAREATATIRHYGESYCDSKAVEERLFANAIKAGDFEGVILRPTIVYGPYSGFVLSIIARAQAGDFSLIDDGGGICNAVFIDDVCEAIIAASTTKEGLGKAMFISSTAVTWREFNDTFARMVSPAFEFRNIPSAEARSRFTTPGVADNLRATLRMLVSPDFHAQLGRIPVVKPMIRGVKQSLSDQIGEDRKVRLKLALQGPLSPAATGPDLPWPTADRILRETCRVAFTNDLARSVLPWTPKYDLAAGAAITRQWLEFARFAEPTEDLKDQSKTPLA